MSIQKEQEVKEFLTQLQKIRHIISEEKKRYDLLPALDKVLDTFTKAHDELKEENKKAFNKPAAPAV